MNKILPVGIGVIVVVALAGGAYTFLHKPNVNNKPQERIETPPSVSKVNALPLGLRPFVALVPHSNSDTSKGCNGVDLIIDSLKNGEAKTEYQLEYTAMKKVEGEEIKSIQGVFGRREFTQKTDEYKPLEFGTCSKGRCVCDPKILGGNLTLSFSGKEDYTLKGDFSVQNVGQKDGVLASPDARLSITVGDALPKTADVLVMNTFGLPAELPDEVLVGPYGIFAEGVKDLKKPLNVTLQSQNVSQGKIQFWDGKAWQKLEAKVDGDKATFELKNLGIIALTK